MRSNRLEKRGSQRAVFSIKDNICAQAVLGTGVGAGEEDGEIRTVSVVLLDISIGGLQFMAPRHRFPKLGVGERLVLSDIRTPPPLGTIDRLDVAVKHINDTDSAIFVFGCEFAMHPRENFMKIHQYVSRFPGEVIRN